MTMTDQPSPEVMSLARRLMDHPNALKGIRNTEARMQEQREAARAKTVHVCPYCAAAGVPIRVAGHEYTRRRDDCCQQAIFEAAKVALYYSTDEKNPEDASLQQARFYAVLKVQLTDPALTRELATYEFLRAGG